MKKIKKLFLILCGLQASCSTITIPNSKVCTVAGAMSAGADCAYTLDSKTEEMTLDEFLDFLEPKEEVIDPITKKIIEPARGGALCTPVSDFNAQKTALEQACEALGSKCSYEIKEAIQKVSNNVTALQAKALSIKEEKQMIKISSVPALGNVGNDIVKLQQALNAAGFSPGSVDGIFGKNTAKAVSAFQKSKGLPGSGVIGPKTLEFLGLEVSVINPVSGAPAITKDIVGKRDRKLHPTLRLLLEAKVFPSGEIPQCFKDRKPQDCYVLVMQKMAELGIHEEGGNNKGTLVGYVQGVTGSYTHGGNGDAWCNDYCQCGVALVEDYFQQESPMFGSAHCMTTLRESSKVSGLVTKTCEVGTVALAKHGNTDSGHAMAVVAILPGENMKTSEGNTSIANMRDGDGSGIKTRNRNKNGDLVTQGFVRLYPNNVVPV